MKQLVECVPNFSEGRREEVLHSILAAIKEDPSVMVLDREMDPDHNRSVVTFVAEPEAARDAAFRAIARASQLIDLTRHQGEHPRMGATDVVPFIPLQGVTMEDCARLARELGALVGEKLEIPVFLYEEAATRPERKNLAAVREGQFEGLREKIGRDPERKPDFGPEAIHPTAGATAIGARFFLVAYNVNLRSRDLKLAKSIARQIRESSGGFPAVKAMGFDLAAKEMVQVSLNLTDYRKTGMATVFAKIAELARDAGVEVAESELIGLVPREAVLQAAAGAFKLAGFSPTQVIEQRMETMRGQAWPGLDEFLDDVVAPSPTPGGGSVAALLGTLSSSLSLLVFNLTVDHPRYQEHAKDLKGFAAYATKIKNELRLLIKKDADAYQEVVKACKLPKGTDEEKTKRRDAVRNASMLACEVPLETMIKSLEALKIAELACCKGNRNAITDAAIAAKTAANAITGARYNVQINLSSLKDEKVFLQKINDHFRRIEKESRAIMERVDQMVKKVLEDTGG